MITVIIPVYNVEKYLEKCVNSVLVQTYKDLEIILVDDGSTDSSSLLCDKLKSKDNRIKVIHKKNQGLGLARNSGLKVASGQYVTFVDSDDFIDQDLVLNLLSAINKNGIDTAIGGFKRIEENDKIVREEHYVAELYTGENVLKSLLPRLLGSAPEKSDSLRPSVWNCLYSMDIIKKHKILFPSERDYISEDIIFDLHYYQYAKGVQVLDNISYNYRINDNSLTRKYKKDGYYLFKKLYKKELEIVEKYNILEYTKNRITRQFFVNTLECIRQEKVRIAKKSFKDCLECLKNICADNTLLNAIEEYPVRKLGIRQQLFLFMVKNKCCRVLYLLTK
ncbi:MAG: glycosyltransferase [Erysipelotrichales bacterium]|nr:glycosyltransferase [Erysipelotrichales bacterium]